MVMCNWVQNRIPAFLSGDLSASTSKWVRWHIDQCHVCQKALRALKKLEYLVAEALPIDARAPAALTARVLAIIDGLAPPPTIPPRRRRRWWWPWARE